MNKLLKIFNQKVLNSDVSFINKKYKNLRYSASFKVTGNVEDDKGLTIRRSVVFTGRQLIRASSNLSQGKLLYKLAAFTSNDIGSKINIIEFGTCVGISGMYLLAGMNKETGGKLTTFEGISELAEISKNNFDEFLQNKKLFKSKYDIKLGRFKDTVVDHITNLNEPIHLAFVDGDHSEKTTLKLHNLLKKGLHSDGIIVHDDISDSEEMARAWEKIKMEEGANKIAVLKLGGIPSRGIVFMSGHGQKEVQTYDLDNFFERILRRLFRKFKI